MNEDRISQLPDPLICQILNHLSTKESVKTSVLSTRWRNLWLWVPSLELSSLDFQDFDAFVSFGDRVFDSNIVECLQKLDLTIFEERNRIVDDVSFLTAWMDAAAKRKIQHFDFYWHGNLQVHTKHLSLYKCETLVSLKLVEVTFDDVEFVSFPCLKTMKLDGVSFPNKASFEKLLSRCPVLEDLYVFFNDDDGKGFQVQSRSLKKLSLGRHSFDPIEPIPGVVIDAPLLCCLSILDDSVETIIVNNWQSNAKLDISLIFGLEYLDQSTRSYIRRFLSGISRVGDMKICAGMFKRIIKYSKVEPLPQFGFMSRLDAKLYKSDVKCLPTFLESCPNLKSLILVWEAGNEEMSQAMFVFTYS